MSNAMLGQSSNAMGKVVIEATVATSSPVFLAMFEVCARAVLQNLQRARDYSNAESRI